MIACVQIRNFATSTERQHDPALIGVPLILIAYKGQRGKVAAMSAEAAQAGVRPGLAFSCARALCPQGAFLTLDPSHCEQALDHLLATLWTYTSHVEIDEIDYLQTLTAYLDLGHLNERDLRLLAQQIIDAIGGDVTVGLASGKFPAFVAATTSRAGQIILVPKGGEALFIAPHPTNLLPMSKAVAGKLHLLFIRKIGELAALSRAEMTAEFGRPGRQLYWLAQGIDGRPITPHRMPQAERAERRFNHAVMDRTRLDAVVQSLADDLSKRLETRVAAAHHLTLTIMFERGETIVQQQHLFQPVQTAKGIAQEVQRLIERIPASASKKGIIGIAITVMQFVSGAPRQLELLTHRPARQQLIDLTPALVERYGACFYEAVLAEQPTLIAERRFHLRRIGGA